MRSESVREARKKWNRETLLAEKQGWYHSFELPDGGRIEGVQTLEQQQNRWARFALPDDLRGRRVLDIGAWDGWFSFEAERRGAGVVAVDCVEIPNFLRVHEALNSRVDYRILDVYELPEAGLGSFDYVFFLGVLYHLKHPLLALEIVCGLTREVAIVESFVTDGDTWRKHAGEIPAMEFYETDELCGLLDNWIGPSVGCLMALCRAAGFARVELLHAQGAEAVVACHRRWEPVPERPLAAPELLSAVHTRNYGVNFYTRREEYITWWFRAGEETLTREDLRLEVGGFGVRANYLGRESDGTWHANSRLPPGLAAGWQQTRLRTARSGHGNSLRIAVDIPPASGRLVIESACDGFTWQHGTVRAGENAFLSCWVRGLGDNCDLNNVRLRLGAERLALTYIGEADEDGLRQINARMPSDVAKGNHPLTVSFGETTSLAVPVRVE